MKALREWCIKSGWFIVQSDPGPDHWSMWALSPTGAMWSFCGSPSTVDGWDCVPSLNSVRFKVYPK
jgi:hypothetical protein